MILDGEVLLEVQSTSSVVSGTTDHEIGRFFNLHRSTKEDLRHQEKIFD